MMRIATDSYKQEQKSTIRLARVDDVIEDSPAAQQMLLTLQDVQWVNT